MPGLRQNSEKQPQTPLGPEALGKGKQNSTQKKQHGELSWGRGAQSSPPQQTVLVSADIPGSQTAQPGQRDLLIGGNRNHCISPQLLQGQLFL